MSRLDNKVALITGGTSGMGAATARLFADEGATVVVTGSNPDTLEKARAAMPGIEVLASDASDLAAIRSLIAGVKARHGRIDVLFVNAGTAGYVPYDQVDEPFFNRVFNLNVKGAAFLMQEAAPIMPDGSTMILTGSMAHAMAMPNNTIYSASKAALRSLGRTFAGELASRGIRVNMISPGPVVTPIWTKITGAQGEQLKMMEAQIAAKIPLKRAGQPNDIAQAALFLASDAASYITGIDLPVDGGAMMVGFG